MTTQITECQRQGDEMRLYYSLSGDCDTPVYVEHVGIIGDLTLSDVADENQVQRRGASGGTKTYNPGDKEVSITGTQIVAGDYDGYNVIRSAGRGGSPVDFLILTGPLSDTNSVGYRGKFYNFDNTINGPAEGEMDGAVNLKPAACSDCPVREVKVVSPGTAADWDPTNISGVSS